MMNRVPYPRGPFQEIIEFFGSVHDESCALSGISDRDEEIRYQGQPACGLMRASLSGHSRGAWPGPKGQGEQQGRFSMSSQSFSGAKPGSLRACG
jgi:hypothetical protein